MSLCKGFTSKGLPCSRKVKNGSYCCFHSNKDSLNTLRIQENTSGAVDGIISLGYEISTTPPLVADESSYSEPEIRVYEDTDAEIIDKMVKSMVISEITGHLLPYIETGPITDYVNNYVEVIYSDIKNSSVYKSIVSERDYYRLDQYFIAGFIDKSGFYDRFSLSDD